MIEKIIHYVWLGGKPLPERYKKFIEKWKEIFVGYEFKKWDESTFDINSNEWVKKAIELKNYSLAADVIRSWALLNYGGIYLDTDVEIRKTFTDRFWNADLVLGYMYDDAVSTAVIMAKAHHPFIKFLLDKYETLILDTTSPNNGLMTQALLEFYPNFRLNGKYSHLEDNGFIFPKNYFEEPVMFGKGGYSVHHFMGSWHASSNSLKTRLRPLVKWCLFHCRLANYAYQKINRRLFLKNASHYKRYLEDVKNS